MTSQAARAPLKKGASSPSRMYRGVKLQTPATPPKTPLANLQHALDTAWAKHVDAHTGGK